MVGLFPCRCRKPYQGLRLALDKRFFLMCRGWPGRFIRLSNLSRLPVAKGMSRLPLSQLCKVRSVTCRYLAQAAMSIARDWYIALNLEASCMRESGSWRRRYIRHLFIYNVVLCIQKITNRIRAGRCTRARGASFAALAATLAVRASLALGLRRRLGAARGCALCAGGNALDLAASPSYRV